MEPVPETRADRPSTEISSSLDIGGTIGDFEIQELIGRGGMGVVYKARQLSTGRIVALKTILDPVADETQRVRFRAEIESLAALDHENVVRIYGAVEHSGRHFFAMEYVPGQSLAELVRDQPLLPKVAAQYLREIASGIQHAHDRRVLHRDLTPANILVGPDGRPRITDFGIAKRLDTPIDATRTGAVIGSPNYLAPEQLASHRGSPALDHRSDIYALGAVLFHSLTGRPPFVGATLQETLLQVIDSTPIAPRRLNPFIPADLETICLRCLEKEPDRRYQSAADVEAELTRFLEGHPIVARPIGWTGRTWRWCRRQPMLASTIVCLAAALAGGTVGVEWQWRRAEANADQARAVAQNLAVTVTQLRLQQAGESLANGDVDAGLACFASVLRANPSNRVAASRIVAALTQRNFPLPLTTNDPLLLEHLQAPRSGKHRYRIERFPTYMGLRVIENATGKDAGPALAFSNLVSSSSLSSDGRLVAIGLADGSGGVFEIRSGLRITTPFRHANTIKSINFSPDGQRVVTGSFDGSAQVWNAQSGEPAAPVMSAAGRIWTAVFSPDGTKVAAASEDRTARIWHAGTAKLLTPPLIHGDTVNFVEFSPDGGRLLTTSNDRMVRIWDARTGEQLSEPFRHHGDIQSVSIAPDQRHVLTCASDYSARLWEIPFAPVPVPAWFPALAEAVARLRTDERGQRERLSLTNLIEIRTQIANLSDNSAYTSLAKWFFADRKTRPVSPYTAWSTPQYVERRVQEGTEASLYEALRIAPSHPLALERLAKRLAPTDPSSHPRIAGEAEFYSRRASASRSAGP